jgi:hypothetical protein
MGEPPKNKRARKRERQAQETAEAERRFKDASLARDVLRRPIFSDLGIRPVDVEIVSDFSGSPENMFAWLIFATSEEASAAREPKLTELIAARARDRLSTAGFPEDAVPSFRFDFTSLPEIERRGGRFAFFR